jgi:uncharacterized protein with GYD domain
MQYFLIQFSYTSAAWDALIKKPQNRLQAMSPTVENLGGKIVSAFLMLGDYDVLYIVQMPDHISSAALSMAIMAGGAVRNVKIVQLMSWDEGVEAMKKARKAVYKPPTKDPMLDRR